MRKFHHWFFFPCPNQCAYCSKNLFVKVLSVSKCYQIPPPPQSIESIQCQWSGNTKPRTSFQWKHHQGSTTQYLYGYLSINSKHRQIESIVVSEILQIPEQIAWINVRHANNIDAICASSIVYNACCKHLLFLCVSMYSFMHLLVASLF